MDINNNIYIRSLEANEIYSNIYRGQALPEKYVGMLPYSLLTKKLLSEGMVVQEKKNGKKLVTDDIINVSFEKKVKCADDIIKDTKVKITELINSAMSEKEFEELNSLMLVKGIDITNKYKVKDYLKKNKIKKVRKKAYNTRAYIISLEKFIIRIEKDTTDNPNNWKEIKNTEIKPILVPDRDGNPMIINKDAKNIRTILYEDGFTLTKTIKKRGQIDKVVTTNYCVLGRSSSKSRTGNVLFIKQTLKQPILDWMRMSLPITEDSKIDFPALLSYEFLVGSSAERFITIPTKSMLIVDDVKSVFTTKCNVTKKNSTTGHLYSELDENWKIESSLFDGECLLEAESEYFEGNESMLLLRQHMFKSAGFATFIQKYLIEYHEENIKDVKYEDWQLPDMFGNKVFAKNIKIIFCPTSLKALKFSNLVGTDADMYKYWQQKIEQEHCTFAIIKHEKESKRGTDKEGNILQQMSYQMLGSIDLSIENIDSLLKIEKEYISDLKNNTESYVRYLESDSNMMNSNSLMVDLYRHNKLIEKTGMFKDYKTDEISIYGKYVKSAKLRQKGDYCILLGNPLCLLKHAVGDLPVLLNSEGEYVLDENYKDILEGNEIYTTLFSENGKQYVMFRNPHNSPSNINLGTLKTNVPELTKYFNLSKNIVVCNAVQHPLQTILNSCDYDSDSAVIFDSDTLISVFKDKVIGKYFPVEKDDKSIGMEKTNYKINNTDMAIIDTKLSQSQRLIGEVTNVGALILSRIYNTDDTNVIKLLLQYLDVITALSTVAIDLAKKMYSIDIDLEIINIRKLCGLFDTDYKKPLWWKANNKKPKDMTKEKWDSKHTKYNIGLDCLIGYKFDNAEESNTATDIRGLLVDNVKLKNADRNQYDNIMDLVDEFEDGLTALRTQKKSANKDNKDKQKEIDEETIDVIDTYLEQVSKKSIKQETMYKMVKIALEESNVSFLNSLYMINNDKFLLCFKKGA